MIITRDMAIGEVVQKYPSTIEVFLRHGLMCFGCAIARFALITRFAMGYRTWHVSCRSPLLASPGVVHAV